MQLSSVQTFPLLRAKNIIHLTWHILGHGPMTKLAVRCIPVKLTWKRAYLLSSVRECCEGREGASVFPLALFSPVETVVEDFSPLFSGSTWRWVPPMYLWLWILSWTHDPTRVRLKVWLGSESDTVQWNWVWPYSLASSNASETLLQMSAWSMVCIREPNSLLWYDAITHILIVKEKSILHGARPLQEA